MLEIRGISDYERFSSTGGKSRRGEADGAEFKQLMQTGEPSLQPQTAPEEGERAEGDLFAVSGPETVMYNGYGRISPVGAFVGRNLDVAI